MCSENKDLERRFQAAMDQYADMVYRIAVNQMKSREDADDIFQEVFIKWMQHRDEFENQAHEKAWMIRVTINMCKNMLTSSWRKKHTEFSPELENTLSCEDTIEEESELMPILEQLPEKYRIAIHLFYFEELSIREIAQATGERESTVRTQLTRARRKLKKLLKGVEL